MMSDSQIKRKKISDGHRAGANAQTPGSGIVLGLKIFFFSIFYQFSNFFP